jgi:Fe-S cluster assembly protein SufD
MGKPSIIDNGKKNRQIKKQLSLRGKDYPGLPLSSTEKINKYFANSWESFSQIPFPSKKDEAWRRTPIDSLELESLLYVPANKKNFLVTKKLPTGHIDDFSGQIKLNTGTTKINVKSGLVNSGLIFMDLHTAIEQHPDMISPMLGSIIPASDGKFAALTSALAGDGAILIVPQGMQIDPPFKITINHPKPKTANFYHFIIWLERGSKASVIIEYLSPHSYSTEQVMIGDILEINVGEEAKLDLCEIQALGTHVWSFSHQRARISQDSEINWIYGGVGGHLTKTYLDVDLVGKNAIAEVGGLFISDLDQHFDFDTQQNHLDADTTSNLLFKCAHKGKSKSVWQGMIHVAPNARGADGYQKSSTLILSDGAKASAIPGLEILNNDVKCSHGATINNLSPDELFYLQTRGISRDEGEKLLVRGFFNQITEMINNPGNRKQFEQLIDKKLNN